VAKSTQRSDRYRSTGALREGLNLWGRTVAIKNLIMKCASFRKIWLSDFSLLQKKGSVNVEARASNFLSPSNMPML
jgi:hypothetical protein